MDQWLRSTEKTIHPISVHTHLRNVELNYSSLFQNIDSFQVRICEGAWPVAFLRVQAGLYLPKPPHSLSGCSEPGDQRGPWIGRLWLHPWGICFPTLSNNQRQETSLGKP